MQVFSAAYNLYPKSFRVKHTIVSKILLNFDICSTLLSLLFS